MESPQGFHREPGTDTLAITARALPDTALDGARVRVWLEDLNENQMYERISEDFLLQKNTGDYQLISIPHCPLRAGKHWLRIHLSKGGVAVSTVQLRAEANKN